MIRRLLLLLMLLPAAALACGLGVHVWAVYHWRVAVTALGRYHPTEARGHLDHCLRVWPGSGTMHLLTGRAARQTGDFDEAEKHLEAAQRLLGVTEATSLEWAMLQAQQGNLDPVEEFLRGRVDKKHPQSSLIMEALADGYLRMYRVLDAMTCLKRWLDQTPDDPQAHYLRGRAWERVHAYPQAAEDFRRVVEIDPERDDARLGLTNALLEFGQAAEAIPHLEELRRRRPEDPEVLVRLAGARNMLGDAAGALPLLDALLARHPDYAPALAAHGQLALQAGRRDEAERWLRQAVAINPYDRQANYLLYQCLQQLGKEDEAEEQHVRLKRVEANIERLIEISNHEMALNPHDPELHYGVGVLLTDLGHEDLGVRWLHSALQQDPKHRKSHEALAAYYGRTGDAEKAAHHRELAGP